MNATNPKKPTASTQPSAMPLNSVENSSSNEHEGGEKMDALNAIIGGLTTWSDRRREATLKKQERIEQKRAVERKNGQSLGAGASGLLGGAVGKGLAFAKRTAGVWIVACALIGGAGAIVENNAAQMNASYDWMLVNAIFQAKTCFFFFVLLFAEGNAFHSCLVQQRSRFPQQSATNSPFFVYLTLSNRSELRA